MSNLEDLSHSDFKGFGKEGLRSSAGHPELGYSNKQTNISAGMRATHYGTFDITEIEPRVSASLKGKKYFSLVLLGELKHQASTQIIDRQNDFLGLET